jgi:hypothetical protein
MVADVLDGKNVRFILTWSHPELHPELWSNGLGAPMPAPTGRRPRLAQALVPTTQPDGFVEVRLPEDAQRAARLAPPPCSLRSHRREKTARESRNCRSRS